MKENSNIYFSKMSAQKLIQQGAEAKIFLVQSQKKSGCL